MTRAVAVTDLSLSYGGRAVLSDLSFQVEAGEFFVIIGPNGAGKTTLLKTLAGLIKAESGQVEILGRKLSRYSRRELARLVAMVPQQMPEEFPFSVAETVLMGRAPHLGLIASEREEDYQLARRAMDFTDVGGLADRRLDQLSGGERQRVIIARAICQKPKIMLLDEPTGALDPAHQLQIMDLMERFRKQEETTIIMISHDLNLAGLYGDRLLLVKDGRCQTCGPPHRVLTAAQLEESYGCTLLVDENPRAARPRVTLMPEKFRAR